MTREEKLYSMRGKDLVQYCLDSGIKVHQSRGLLKEARAGVIQRILDFEANQNYSEKISYLANIFKSRTDQDDVSDIMDELNNLGSTAIIEFLNLVK